MSLQAVQLAAMYLTRQQRQALRLGEMALPKLFRSAQGSLLQALRRAFERVAPGSPLTLQTARQSGVLSYLKSVVEETADLLGQRMTDTVSDLAVDVVGRALKAGSNALLKAGASNVVMPMFQPLEARSLVKQEWAGASTEDRLLSLKDKLKEQLFGSLRTGMIQQESYEAMRARILKQMGVSNLAKPAFSAYGSVKIWQNEARRLWGETQAQFHAANPDLILVWRSVLGRTTEQGCANNHGRTIDGQLGGQRPPLHINCKCDILFVPKGDLRDVQTTMRDERQTWKANHPATRKGVK